MAENQIGPGVRIGGYEVREELGRGGMGLVFKAYHDRLQRWAAVKVLLNFGRRGDEMARFEREAQAVARLRHPHVLTVFDFGELAGQPYMITEFMEHGSLESRMPGVSAAREAVGGLVRPIAEALDYAHAQGVIHRDVKPANVFLDSNYRPVLADFGLAKLYTADSITMTGAVSGTPSHMSPEQARGHELTGATDQYSLAIMAYVMVAGRLPFSANSVMDMLYAQVQNEPPPPSTFNPALSPAVDAVMLKALAKRPEDRWPSCTEFAAALEAALKGELAPAQIPKPPANAEILANRRQRRRGVPAAAVAAALLALLLIGGGVAYAMRPQGAAPAAQLTPSAAPSAASSPERARFLTVSPPSPLKIGGTVTVSGRGLDPRRNANVGIQQGASIHPFSSGIEVRPDGSFAITAAVPSELQPGQVSLVACNVDAQNRSSAADCVELKVTLIR